MAAPVALRAAGASWLRHWETVLAPALDAVGGEIVSLEMRFSGAEIVAVAPNPIAAFGPSSRCSTRRPKRGTS